MSNNAFNLGFRGSAYGAPGIPPGARYLSWAGIPPCGRAFVRACVTLKCTNYVLLLLQFALLVFIYLCFELYNIFMLTFIFHTYL